MKTITIFLVLNIILMTGNAQQFTTSKVFIDSAGSSQAYSIVKTNDHNYLIAGVKDSSSGLVVKVDTAGAILWSKAYGSLPGASFSSIIATSDNDFLLTGQIYNPLQLTKNIFCIKINPDGDTIWSKVIDFGFTDVNSVLLTNDHGFILAGSFGQNPYPWARDFVIRLDSAGNLLWSKLYSGGNNDNNLFSIRQTPDNGFIASGYVEDSASYLAKPCLIKLAADGAVEWAEKEISSQYKYGYDVAVTQGGLLWFIAFNYLEVIVLKTDLNGNLLSGKEYYSPSFWGMSNLKVHSVSDGQFVGVLDVGMNSGSYLFKSDSTGNLSWMQNVMVHATDVVESKDHGFLLAGNGPLLGNIDQVTPKQIGIFKTDSLGNCPQSCVFTFVPDIITFQPVFVPVTITSETGILSVTAIHPQVVSTPISEFEGCVAVGFHKDRQSEINRLEVFPNPANREITFDSKLLIVEYEISNLFGYVFKKNANAASPLHLDLTDLTPGMYLYKMRFLNGLTRIGKFIKSK